MTCSFMRLAPLQFELKLQKCIRMGITIFKIFIWGGISSDIRWKSRFIRTVYPMIYLPKWKFWKQLSPNLHPKNSQNSLGNIPISWDSLLRNQWEVRGLTFSLCALERLWWDLISHIYTYNCLPLDIKTIIEQMSLFADEEICPYD